jgi:hypothetical protein
MATAMGHPAMMAGVDEVEVVVAHNERATLRAVASGGGDQNQPAAQPFIELGRQPGARHQPGPRRRDVQLGPQQDVTLGGRSTRVIACRRLSHR